MADDSEQATKKRKYPWEKPYSKVPLKEVEKRIGTTMIKLYHNMISPKNMLVQAGYCSDDNTIKATKDEVYKGILRYLAVETPLMDHKHFKEANVGDLVLQIILPIIYDFKQNTGRKMVTLFREKQIVSTDSKVGGFEEFVVVDVISELGESNVLIIEAKRESLSAAMGQCLLAMKDLGDTNKGGIIYGFVTTRDVWRMLSYDGAMFQVTDKLFVVFDLMRDDRDEWMRSFSLVVDCIYAALSNGGVGTMEKGLESVTV